MLKVLRFKRDNAIAHLWPNYCIMLLETDNKLKE